MYGIVIVILIGVMLFSGFQIVRQILHYRIAARTYSDLEKEVAAVAESSPDSTFARPTFDIPAVEPSRTEPAETPTETEPAATLKEETSSAPEETSQPESSEESTLQPETTEPVTEPDTQPVTEEPSEAEPTEEETTTAVQAQPRELPWLNIDFASLRAKNSQIVGWLQGMDGEINLPVCQGTDNEYYLHHLIDGTYNFAGTLFVDYRNRFLQDDMSFIYGHKMKDGSMFAMIDKYDLYSYYSMHPYFRLYTPDAVYELYVMTSIYTSDMEPVLMNFGSNYVSTVNSYKYRGQYWTNITAEPGDKLICLYTCAFHIKDGRLMIILKAVRVA